MESPQYQRDLSPATARFIATIPTRRRTTPLKDIEQRILDALSWLDALASRARFRIAMVGVLADIRFSTTVFEWCMVLERRRFVECEGIDVRLTRAGRSAARAVDGPVTLAELHQRVIEHQWGPTERGLKALLAHYPKSFSRAEFAVAADLPEDSFMLDETLKQLLRQGLLDYTSGERLIAGAALFLISSPGGRGQSMH